MYRIARQMLLLDDPEGSNPSSPLANPSPPLLGPGPRHRWPRCDLLFFFPWLLPVWKISNGAAFVFCPIWTLVRYWRWFVRSCTEASPCKGLCKLVKRLTRSPSSRTTIAAAGAFVSVDRVDPVRHPRLWLEGLKSTLLVVSVPTALCESSTSAFLYFPRTVVCILRSSTFFLFCRTSKGILKKKKENFLFC